MSGYFQRTVLYRPRTSTLLRLYGTKAAAGAQPRLQPAGPSEDALKILEDLSALDITDPNQVFDEDVIYREDGFDFGNEDGEELPQSPIMDKKAWKRRFKQEKKLKKPHPSEMTEEELSLMKNPYANALITPIRQDGYYRRVFPSFFLQKLHAFINPDTKEPWILPMGIRARDESKVVKGLSKYIAGNHTHLEFLKSKRWKKLQDSKFVTSAIWRQDMEDFVLRQLQNRVYDEVAATQRWTMSANRDGGKWEDMRIGCLLVWENGDPGYQATATEKDEGSVSDPQVKSREEAKEDGEGGEADRTSGTVEVDIKEVSAARSLVRVKGKLVPSYKMHLLLGRERAAELKKQLKIETVVRKNVLLISPRTMKVQTWLWKLAGYARQPDTNLFDELDSKVEPKEQLDGALTRL